MDLNTKVFDSPSDSNKLDDKFSIDDESDDYYDNNNSEAEDSDDDLYNIFDEDDYLDKGDETEALDDYDLLQAQFDKADMPTGVEISLPSLIKAPAASSSSSKNMVNSVKSDNLLETIIFKNFDVVDSFKVHHYQKKGSANKEFPKEWSKVIQKEWKSLTTDLPETIYVRVAEERMDLLRAAIVGPAGTPYHDGLFFFDCFFPPEYPNKPPLVYYHSGGLRLNPNLYSNGKVCLSLLGTWSGKDSENWMAGKSTMLQVLVSIQALILNEKPFFNEPGYDKHYTGKVGDDKSNNYSERTFILSLKTIVYTLRNPPEHFKDLVVSHFRLRGRNILIACKAYTNGALVASDLKYFKICDESSKKCSPEFRRNVNGLVNMLVACFLHIKTPNCDEFRVDPNITVDENIEENTTPVDEKIEKNPTKKIKINPAKKKFKIK